MRSTFALFLLLASTCSAQAVPGDPPAVTFMEPAEDDLCSGDLSCFRVVDDDARVADYLSWMENEWAHWALDLYAQALRTAGSEASLQPASFHVALVPGGNHADSGFEIVDAEESTAYPRAAYIKLGPDEWRFTTTLLHETGHVVLTVLNGGREIPKREIAAIPHTTAALTDRGTAFDEGYAIHLETLMAHIGMERFTHDRYKRGQFLFGSWPGLASEYYRHSSDLLSFAQTVARYHEVRENNFAFRTAYRGDDYLRAQMEKARDFAELRNPDQLLQSEGFYASFFFGAVMRGKTTPPVEVVRQRQAELLAAIKGVLSVEHTDEAYLLHVVQAYGERYPDERSAVLDVFLDLSHGVFVDPDAREMWREHYLAALRLDISGLKRESIDATRERWRARLAEAPGILFSRVGPQIRCLVPESTVTLVALESSAPLSFDINTVQPGILELIPGITPAEIEAWVEQRERRPFQTVADFKERTRLGEAALASMTLEP